jgi:predicted dehydrogenase
VSGGYLQDWLLLDTDWNWRLDPAEGGILRAVGDIGSHWIDLLQYVSGLSVEAAMADLATFVPVRRVPVGPVETFAGAAAGERVERAMETEDAAGILLRLTGGARDRHRLPGQPRPAQPLRVRGRRRPRLARLGLRAPRGAVDRPS